MKHIFYLALGIFITLSASNPNNTIQDRLLYDKRELLGLRSNSSNQTNNLNNLNILAIIRNNTTQP